MRFALKPQRGATLLLRSVATKQRPRLVRCLKDAADYRRHYTDHPTALAWTNALLWEAEADDDRIVCLVERLADKEPLAVVELVRDHPGQVTIALLAVRRSARLLGVGREVVTLLSKHFRARGTRELALGVAAKNRAAVAFWEALGFARTGTMGTSRERLLTMSKDLSREPPSLHPDGRD